MLRDSMPRDRIDAIRVEIFPFPLRRVFFRIAPFFNGEKETQQLPLRDNRRREFNDGQRGQGR